MPRKRITRAAAAIAALAATALIVSACTKVEEGEEAGSAFPENDIRLIIQANPGGGSDLSSRALATELEKILGVSVIPENMPGAAGALAMEYVGAQDADGYVIGFAPVEIAMLNTTQSANVLPDDFDLLGRSCSPRGRHGRREQRHRDARRPRRPGEVRRRHGRQLRCRLHLGGGDLDSVPRPTPTSLRSPTTAERQPSLQPHPVRPSRPSPASARPWRRARPCASSPS